MELISVTKYTFFWRARDGSEYEISCSLPSGIASVAAAREVARQGGYPGHCGGWWNWLVEDAHEWLAKRGWTRCKCHSTPTRRQE